jgi:uncharacterized protein (DUF362 family)
VAVIIVMIYVTKVAIVKGTDPVAVDAVGAAVMRINPNNVKHLRLAEKKGLGTCNLEQIEI